MECQHPANAALLIHSNNQMDRPGHREINTARAARSWTAVTRCSPTTLNAECSASSPLNSTTRLVNLDVAAPSTLTLLVARIAAHDVHHSTATHDLALIANAFHASSDLHRNHPALISAPIVLTTPSVAVGSPVHPALCRHAASRPSPWGNLPPRQQSSGPALEVAGND